MEVQIPKGMSIVISNNGLFVFTEWLWRSAVLSTLRKNFR